MAQVLRTPHEEASSSDHGCEDMFRMIATMKFEWIRCLVLTMALNFVHSVRAGEEIVWSGPGCVLLKNGNVLSATDIVPQGKLVAVRLDETGEARIPAKDIVTIGRDKLELYNYQVAKTTRWEAGEHWQLAKWCLRQGLVEQSHVHYEQLKKLSGTHAKFKQLDSELKQALLQDPVMKAALNAALPTEQVSSASHPDSVGVDALGRTSLDGAKSATVASAKHDVVKSAIKIDRNAQDYFRQNIQPFLAMRCGQAGCHGAYGKSDFHIAKVGVLHGQPSSEISLNSAAQFLDNENIEATKLWINATTAHGTQTTPSLTTKDSAERDLLNRLRLWHQAVMRTNAVVTISPMVQVSPASRRADPTDATMSRNPIGLLPRSNTMAEGKAANVIPSLTRAVGPEIPLPEIGDELLMLEKEIAKLEEKERAKKSSRRHDPEEFNRRFSGSTP